MATIAETLGRIRAAMANKSRLDGVTLDDIKAVGEWNQLGRLAKVKIDDVTVRVMQGSDSTTGETWFDVVTPKTWRPTQFTMLTTPEEKSTDALGVVEDEER